MIPPIPAAGDPPAGPTCCPELFDQGQALLAWIWSQISSCVGNDDSTCGRMITYVSWGPPIVRPSQPNILAVFLDVNAGVAPIPTANEKAQNIVLPTQVTWGIELWEGCYPIPDDRGNGPTYAQFHEANRHAYAHGLKLWNTLVGGVKDGTITGLDGFRGCTQLALTAMTPKDGGAPGVSVGWATKLKVRW